jgi:hypothetical protein
MIPTTRKITLLPLVCLVLSSLFVAGLSGMAPNVAPKLPEGVSFVWQHSITKTFCEYSYRFLTVFILLLSISFFYLPSSLFSTTNKTNTHYYHDTHFSKKFCKHGDVTATTGECMCHWQHKGGCVGSGCQYQMGLSFYHYSCKDCQCVPEP